ncbi:hypothetical protein [Brucella anthropi]|uniref:hypothetical protein n=1 Tax=Brucella anthropi TaxID=529 RepID=UPI00384C076A
MSIVASAPASEHSLTRETTNGQLVVGVGKLLKTQKLRYRKLYEAKPFPNADLFYYDNGLYRITSEGEDHWGVFVLQGSFEDQTYTIRFVSLPSEDWGNKTAFHQLTFINGDKENTFIQNAITDTGEAIAQQNGTFETVTE